MAPHFTLQLPFTNTPCNLIGFKVPPSPNIAEGPLFFASYNTASRLIKILNGERLWAIYGRVDEDVSVPVAYCYTIGYGWKSDAAAKDSFGTEFFREVECECRATINSSQWRLQNTACDLCWSCIFIGWVLIKSNDCLQERVKV